jgi:dimeric dUTPase (all-alpha-NTP-PPase superfamily)
MNINEIYTKEREINKHFKEKYNYKDEKIFNKQVLQLLCELSEFAYETKCFKYWKNEKQSSKEITIPEFADCLMITLSFCDLANINEIEIEEIKEKNIVKLFIEAYKLASTITTNLEKEKLIKILSYLISISKLLNYTEEELKKYCFIKMNKTLKIITEEN